MDEKRPRERIVSILNNDDCPSFTIRRRAPSPEPERRESLERPNLLRQSQYTGRNSSFSSAGTPPLLRYDSSSSSSSKSTISMESTPSPITPAYTYNDGLVPFNDLAPYMPSPTSMTPFMEQHSLISPSMTTRVAHDMGQKSMPPLAPAQYPVVPIPPSESSSVEPAAPSLISEHSNSTNSKSSPSIHSASNPPAKKNKYPCPYATSHNCHATFTTSGHAARHGKKHTGEKGVHCPICNKAFTRKDNMKQHQRTHKNGSGSISSTSTNNYSENSEGSNLSRRSKAAITKEAATQKAKSRRTGADGVNLGASRTTEPTTVSEHISPSPNLHSMGQSATLYPSPMLLPGISSATTHPTAQPTLIPQALYPPIGENVTASALLNPHPLALPSKSDLTALEDSSNSLPALAAMGLDPSMTSAAGANTIIPPIPPLIRGFSDLDTLAQAAESFDPYYM